MEKPHSETDQNELNKVKEILAGRAIVNGSCEYGPVTIIGLDEGARISIDIDANTKEIFTLGADGTVSVEPENTIVKLEKVLGSLMVGDTDPRD